jgi:hypothetical protein
VVYVWFESTGLSCSARFEQVIDGESALHPAVIMTTEGSQLDGDEYEFEYDETETEVGGHSHIDVKYRRLHGY